jgi:hypothetical protein
MNEFSLVLGPDYHLHALQRTLENVENKTTTHTDWGYAVAQLVEALCYKPEGRGFNSRWSHWNYSVTYSFR